LRHLFRSAVIALTLAAFLGEPALARQEPASQEPGAQPTAEPDEATAEQQSADQAPSGQNSLGTPSPSGAAIPDGAAFEARIRASAAASEGLQGPMDGGWTVRTADGDPLYGFQLVDPGAGAIEGAWRDMRRTGAPGARGLLASLVRVGDDLTVRFYPRDGGNAVLLELHGFSEDVWSGTLSENGVDTPVSLTRNEARPTGDYSGVPRGPVMPNGYSYRPRHPAASARHEERRTVCVKKGRKGKCKMVVVGGGEGRGGHAKGGKSRGEASHGARAHGGAAHGGGSKSAGSKSGGSKKKKKH
jgi:hypothetical protein